MPARTRSRSTRVLGALAAALTTTAVLSACGSDDSTATNTPTTTATSTTESSETTSDETTTDATATDETTGEDAPAEETTGGTEPAPAAPDAGAGAAEVPAAGEDFLAALRAEGVEPGNEAGAVSIADYICSAQAQGSSPEDIKVFVTAMVGSESAAAGAEMSEEEASATADTYVTVASETYCG